MQPQTAEELSELTSSQLLHKLDEVRHGVFQAGYDHAAAEKKFNDLKALMPSFLAEYQAHYSKPGVGPTEARAKALADKGYQEKVKEMNIAEYEARLLEVEYKGWMESIKALTAIGYVRNSELKLAR